MVAMIRFTWSVAEELLLTHDTIDNEEITELTICNKPHFSRIIDYTVH
jgi:hypothetical protein